MLVLSEEEYRRLDEESWDEDLDDAPVPVFKACFEAREEDFELSTRGLGDENREIRFVLGKRPSGLGGIDYRLVAGWSPDAGRILLAAKDWESGAFNFTFLNRCAECSKRKRGRSQRRLVGA